MENLAAEILQCTIAKVLFLDNWLGTMSALNYQVFLEYHHFLRS